MRTHIAVAAVIVPVFVGLGLIHLFTDGAIGLATALAAAFALVAFAVTVVAFHLGADEPDADGVTHSRLRM